MDLFFYFIFFLRLAPWSTCSFFILVLLYLRFCALPVPSCGIISISITTCITVIAFYIRIHKSILSIFILNVCPAYRTDSPHDFELCNTQTKAPHGICSVASASP